QTFILCDSPRTAYPSDDITHSKSLPWMSTTSCPASFGGWPRSSRDMRSASRNRVKSWLRMLSVITLHTWLPWVCISRSAELWLGQWQQRLLPAVPSPRAPPALCVESSNIASSGPAHVVKPVFATAA
ncbi:hypothetical protein K491DRAFT_743559, partial [Lophiostoma macrostomum CBS 122681]